MPSLPAAQTAAQIVIEGLRLRATKVGHESQHEADVVLGGLIVSCPRDAAPVSLYLLGFMFFIGQGGFKRILDHDQSAEELIVSKNTIRTHSKRIYAKLDVHKKQELIDMLKAVEL